ncbi:hypothetical protein Tco_1120337, partial [Tanacetum coccineum]
VSRESLLFVITSFGGVVSWEGYGALFEESNQDINYLSGIRNTVGILSSLSGRVACCHHILQQSPLLRLLLAYMMTLAVLLLPLH